VEQPGRLRVVQRILEGRRLPAPLPIDMGISDDGEYPGLERQVAIERVEAVEGLEQALLEQILVVLGRPGQEHRVVVERIQTAPNKSLEFQNLVQCRPSPRRYQACKRLPNITQPSRDLFPRRHFDSDAHIGHCPAMHLGIFLEERRPGTSEAAAFQETLDLAEAAEASGLDGVWLGEIHFNPTRSVHSAPMALASYIAA